MKIRNFILKGITGLLAFAAVVAFTAVPAKAHTYQDCLAGNHAWKLDYTRIQPTCEKPGCNVYFCTHCFKGIEKYDIPALGHKMDKGHVIVMPTATTDGWCVYRCERCSQYMGDQALKSTGVNYPVNTATSPTTVLDPRVQNPFGAVPMYFDTNMLAVCYIPYHSVITVNGVLANYDAFGAQPLAAFLQAPGKYVIQVTPNTNPEHALANAKTFTVTVPAKAGQAVTVK